MSLIVEVGGVTMGRACDSGSLITYPSSEWRECYRAILPIFHPPLPICESRSRLGAHAETHVAFRTSLRRNGAVIMSKVENMDPVWDDLDR
jgi:hypothetical protein